VIADATAEADQLMVRARAAVDEILSAARMAGDRLEAELKLRRPQEIGASFCRRSNCGPTSTAAAASSFDAGMACRHGWRSTSVHC
jgi:hypothetical protein